MIRITAFTDEISPYLDQAFRIGMEQGIEHFQFRTVYGRRFPLLEADDFTMLLRLHTKLSIHFDAVSLAAWRTGTDQTPWDQLKQIGYPSIFKTMLKMDCKICTVFAAPCFSRDTERLLNIENLRRFTAAASKKGISVRLVNSPATFCNTPEQMLSILRAVGQGNLSLCWDANSMRLGDYQDIAKAYQELAPYITDIRLTDTVELPDGNNKFVPLGEGSFRTRELITLLRNSSYDGRLTLDLHCLNEEESFKKSIQVLNDLLS